MGGKEGSRFLYPDGRRSHAEQLTGRASATAPTPTSRAAPTGRLAGDLGVLKPIREVDQIVDLELEYQ